MENTFYHYHIDRISPVRIRKVGDRTFFVDFGRDAYGQLELTLESDREGRTVEIAVGQMYDEEMDRMSRRPLGKVVTTVFPLVLKKGRHTCKAEFPAATFGGTGVVPSPVGEVRPFRYCEITGYEGELKKEDVTQLALFADFDDDAAFFRSSNDMLDRVWELCRYTIKMSNAFGYYIDGERERTPYEGDAMISALGHYCLDTDFRIAKRTIDFLMKTPNWPVNGLFLTANLIRDYWMYSGDASPLEEWYAKAAARCRIFFENGLLADAKKIHEMYTDEEIAEKTGLSLFLSHWMRDIVDWPAREMDEYDFGKLLRREDKVLPPPTSTPSGREIGEAHFVGNAGQAWSLDAFAEIAEVLGKRADAAFFRKRAAAVRALLRETMFDPATSLYVDVPGSGHTSQHTSMWAIFADIALPEQVPAILRHLRLKRMSCSACAASKLIAALYMAGDEEQGLRLMCDRSSNRSWSNMLRLGATVTMEAWDHYIHPTMDLVHPFSAAPAHLIPRDMVGIKPLAPALKRFSLAPRTGFLAEAELRHPTLRGPIEVSVSKKGGRARMRVRIPEGTEAEADLYGRKDILGAGEHLLEAECPDRGFTG